MIRFVCALVALGMLTTFASADATYSGTGVVFYDDGGPGSASAASFTTTPLTVLASGFASINRFNSPTPLSANSFFDLNVILTSPHAYVFSGEINTGVEVGSNFATAAMEIGMGGGPTTPLHTFIAFDNFSNPFGPMTGTLLPGTYRLRAAANVQGATDIRGFGGQAFADYRLSLVLTPKNPLRPPPPTGGPVPEPASLALLGLGGLAVWLRRRRQ